MALEKAGSIPIGLVIVLALVAAWLLHKLVEQKEATGSVELGVGTVDGVFGNDVYYSRRQPSIETVDDGNPAVDKRMRELIYESSRVISEDDAAEEED